MSLNCDYPDLATLYFDGLRHPIFILGNSYINISSILELTNLALSRMSLPVFYTLMSWPQV